MGGRGVFMSARAILRLSKMVYSPPNTQMGLSSGVELPPPAPTHSCATSYESPFWKSWLRACSLCIFVFKHHYYTTAWRDSKEAGRQLSSFTILGGSANVIPRTLTPWVRVSWRTNKNSCQNFYQNKWHHCHHRWGQIIHARNLYQNLHTSRVSHRIIPSLPTKSSICLTYYLNLKSSVCFEF